MKSLRISKIGVAMKSLRISKIRRLIDGCRVFTLLIIASLRITLSAQAAHSRMRLVHQDINSIHTQRRF
jgi:hypothetical protein